MFSSFRWFYFPFFHIRWEIVLASILIALGVVVVFYSAAKKEKPSVAEAKEPPVDTKTSSEAEAIPAVKRLYRSKDKRIIFGICGGIGDYFDLDPVLIRLVWLLLSFFTGGAGFLVYLILIFVIPEDS